VLTTAGAVKCAGHNNFGQLGIGGTTDTATPTGVFGLTSGVVGISLGQKHACAVSDAGSLKCWGYNAFGQLGNGTATDSPTPIDVTGLTSGITGVSTGAQHSCALTDAGAVKCWGDNLFGELGTGSNADSNTPLDVPGLNSGVAALSLGLFHSCALTTTGGVKCWGRNATGQLGNGANSDANAPVDVNGLTTGVQSISSGSGHSCALTAAGGVKCWGNNSSGQLGDGSTTSSNVPVDVSGLSSGVTALAVGALHSCAVLTNGSIKCWGENANGQLGDGTSLDSSAPVDVLGVASTAIAVSGGTSHSCALTDLGVAKCWGLNTFGALGDGSTTNSSSPVTVTAINTGGTLQSISFPALTTPIAFNGTAQMAATASSGLPVVFDSLTPANCSVSSTGLVTALALKACTVRAQQNGDATFAQAPWQVRSLAITTAAQTVTFGALSNKRVNDAPFTISATGGASGNPVTFASQTPAVCTVAGNTVTLVTTGTCTIRASQTGNANYNAAADVDQSFTVDKRRSSGGGCTVGALNGSDASLTLLALLALGGLLRRKPSNR
jgi:alpha-tubulin suppressor-like RCC1 family protein